MSRGAEYYSEGRYIDAAQVFERGEGNLSQYDATERAQYALYRGSTLLALGELEQARRWLHYGSAIAARNGDALTHEERAALARALATFGDRAPSEALPEDATPEPQAMPSGAMPSGDGQRAPLRGAKLIASP